MAKVDNSRNNQSGKKVDSSSHRLQKANKLKNTRTIRTELYNENQNVKDHNKSNGSYNEFLSKDLSLVKLDDYVDSKKHEIKNLITTIIKNKKFGSNKRAFQNLPRHLRRRTCSHNVKRVPKRIRKRTLKEMAKSEQRVINGNTDSLKHKKSLSSKQYYKMKMSLNLLKLLTRSKFMKRSIPAKIGKFNVGSRFQLRAKIKMMQKLLAENKNLKGEQMEPLLNNRLGHIDLVGKNEVVENTLRLNKSFKYYKRQQGKNGQKWLPSHVYNIKRCHMIKYYGFKVALTPTLKCYRLIHRNNGLNSRSEKTLIQDTCHLGKVLITKANGSGLMKMLSSKFDENKLKFSYKGLYLDGKYYGFINYMKWIEKDSKLLLILDSSVYKNVIEKLLELFKSDINEENLIIEDLTFALGTIKLVGASALNSLLKCIRSHSDEELINESFNDLVVLGTQIKDYKEVINSNFMLGLDIKDPRLIKHPHLPQTKKSENKSIDSDFIAKFQNISKYSTNKQLIALMSHDKRYESYSNKFTIKQLHKVMEQAEKKSGSNIPVLIYKENDGLANSFSVMLPYHWVMPLYYKLNQLPNTQLIGLNQINQISFDNGVESVIKNPLLNVTSWQYNHMSYYNSLSEREHWLRKNKERRVNYDSIKVNYGGFQYKELGDPFRCDWKFLYELHTKGSTKLEDFLKNYNFKYANGEKDITTRFTLNENNNQEGCVLLEVSKLQLSGNSKGNIKEKARVFRVPTNKSDCLDSDEVYEPSVLDLIGFVSVACYDLAEGMSTGYAFYNINHNQSYDNVEYIKDTFLIKNPGEAIFRVAKKVV
ncbi:hypothetical protein QEN19_003992 [Hanseniaspora menglaensis]